MIKKTLLILAAALFGLSIVSFFYFAAPHSATPRFSVKNEASAPVKVTAHWRDNIRDLGELTPGSTIKFSVNDEAAMEFRAIHKDGRVASSLPGIYFTSGSVISAVVTDSSIKIRTQL